MIGCMENANYLLTIIGMNRHCDNDAQTLGITVKAWLTDIMDRVRSISVNQALSVIPKV
jgi:hypothetical protein